MAVNRFDRRAQAGVRARTMGIYAPGRRGRPDQRRHRMFQDKPSAATVAVKNMRTARRFYEETLGLRPNGDVGPAARSYQTGGTTLLVYESQFAGTNKATAATWMVGDEVDGIARDLKAKGVKFEHYDMPDTTRQGDVHVSGNIRVAWFKDPDGNILSIASG
jgi:catechol 2,3-dioxygenase-like lactoylglutathione lyase family enzyme